MKPCLLAVFLPCCLTTGLLADDPPYQPLQVPEIKTQALANDVIHDTGRDRYLTVEYWGNPVLSKEQGPLPVILYSPGIGGSLHEVGSLTSHWARRGYVSIVLDHPGSNERIWLDLAGNERRDALQGAYNEENFVARVQDVRFVLSQLESWNADPQHNLHGQLDVKHIGMAGYDFGAKVAQAVSGQGFHRGAQSMTDDRITAALLMSYCMSSEETPENSFGKVGIPWLLMTGKEDRDVFGKQSPQTRQKVFPALPHTSKYELVLAKGDHATFSGGEPLGTVKPKNPKHREAITAISTAFWDAYLKEDPAARKWLDEAGPRTLLQKIDVWQQK